MLLNKKVDLSTCKLTEEQIEILSKNKDRHIRRAIAQRSDLNEKQIERLSRDEHFSVRHAYLIKQRID